jgi:hypothetical protein
MTLRRYFSSVVTVVLLIAATIVANAQEGDPCDHNPDTCPEGFYCSSSNVCRQEFGCTPLDECGGVSSNCGWGERCDNGFLGIHRCVTDATCPAEPEDNGQPCSPAGCSPTNGCGYGYSCQAVRSGHFCVYDPSCHNQTEGNCYPDATGCSDDCGPNRKCLRGTQNGENGYWCTDVAGVCLDSSTLNECQVPNTCDPICGVGRKCQYNGPRSRLTCVPNEEECGIRTCSESGSGQCDPEACGYGYRCEDGDCLVDPVCTPTTVTAPYTGPKINSFSGLIARFYNLFFPLAIIFGVIFIIKAGYILMTSEGNPQRTRQGQEDLTAAILGTIFVVLSAAILRIIIVQILGGSVTL